MRSNTAGPVSSLVLSSAARNTSLSSVPLLGASSSSANQRLVPVTPAPCLIDSFIHQSIASSRASCPGRRLRASAAAAKAAPGLRHRALPAAAWCRAPPATLQEEEEAEEAPPPPCCPAARPPRPRPAAAATGPASSRLRTRPSGAQPGGKTSSPPAQDRVTTLRPSGRATHLLVAETLERRHRPLLEALQRVAEPAAASRSENCARRAGRTHCATRRDLAEI